MQNPAKPNRANITEVGPILSLPALRPALINTENMPPTRMSVKSSPNFAFFTGRFRTISVGIFFGGVGG